MPHIMLEDTSLGHIECSPLWDVNDEFISRVNVVGH